MKIIAILMIGYLIGCIHPAAVLAKVRNVDLKKEGTHNLGATNTALVLGKASGIFVMVFDILKSILSAKLCQMLFPHISYAGMVACIGCILGHCFPVFLHFRGGKGLAAFGGMVLAYNPWFFVMIVIPGVILMIILNTGVAVPMLACVMFPVLVACSHGSVAEISLSVIACILIAWMHRDNLKKAMAKADVVSTRDFFKRMFRD